MARDDNPRLVTAFAVELVQRLRDQDPAVTPALAWLNQRLAAQGTTADEIALVEHQRQAAMTVTVRNVITSMRLMSALDWTAFFESVSLVDAELGARSNFTAMDFASRDGYRHAIEALARGSGRTELDVARQALAHAAGQRALSVRGGCVHGRPPGRSGLLSHRSRPAGIRARAGLPRAARPSLAARADRRVHSRVSGGVLAADRGNPRHSA